MANQVTLMEAEVRAFSSLLGRVSRRLADYEEQTHQVLCGRGHDGRRPHQARVVELVAVVEQATGGFGDAVAHPGARCQP